MAIKPFAYGVQLEDLSQHDVDIFGWEYPFVFSFEIYAEGLAYVTSPFILGVFAVRSHPPLHWYGFKSKPSESRICAGAVSAVRGTRILYCSSGSGIFSKTNDYLKLLFPYAAHKTLVEGFTLV